MAGPISHVSRWRRASCLFLVGAVGALAGPQAALGAERHEGRQQHATTPVPQVTGPIPVTPSSYPFTAEGTDLAAHGYTLDEYFIDGKANVYDWGADGDASRPQVRTADAPYTTRILVRRPVKRSRFSGTVWVEMNNPSRRWDIEVQWPTVQEKVMRDGDIWVAVTVKPISIAALQRFDAERYGPLSMDNPLSPAQQTCGLLPAQTGYDENTSKLYENGLVWDILSQTGALVRSRSRDNPLRRYDVGHVFATGESQTSWFLNTYAANFASRARLDEGGDIYDGFISVSGAGRTTPVNQCVPATGPDDPRSMLPRRHAPFMRVDAQADVFGLGGHRWPQPSDSDARRARYRRYEIAGAPHGPAFITNYQPRTADIERSGLPEWPTAVYAYGCVEPRANSLPRQYIEPAMYAGMERWVTHGTPPPRAEPLRVVDGVGTQTSLFGETIDASFATDTFGNVLGGVRSSYVDVPVATYHTPTPGNPKPGYPYCWSFGYEDLFGSEQLGNLYGMPLAQQNYVAKVKQNVQQMLARRWVLPDDARKIVLEAELRPIP